MFLIWLSSIVLNQAVVRSGIWVERGSYLFCTRRGIERGRTDPCTDVEHDAILLQKLVKDFEGVLSSR